jgi:hypothetical protein
VNRFFKAGIFVQAAVSLRKNNVKTNELNKFNLEKARKSWLSSNSK